jgi:AraC-like DNA-binding protein
LQGNAELSDTMPAPPLTMLTSDQGHKGTLFLWQDHWQVLGQLMPNRAHRHISASLLVGLDRPFRLAVDGEWRETRAAIVAPDVRQALEPGDARIWSVQLDPDSVYWRSLMPIVAGMTSTDLPLSGADLPDPGETDCEAMAGALARVISRSGHEPVALDDRIAAICGKLRAELPERLELKSLAQSVGLSSSRLTHLFRQETGVPLRRFLLHLKINRALAFWEPGKSVSRLATEAGFYDQPHLVRTARDMFDALPSAYVAAGWFRVCRCGLDDQALSAFSR